MKILVKWVVYSRFVRHEEEINLKRRLCVQTVVADSTRWETRSYDDHVYTFFITVAVEIYGWSGRETEYQVEVA